MADDEPATASGATDLTELTRQQAAEILRQAIPGAKVVSVGPMTGGVASTGAYEVRCADPLQNAVVKVYRKDGGWKLLKEIGVYRLLRENAVTRLPKLLGGDGPNGLLGRPTGATPCDRTGSMRIPRHGHHRSPAD